MTRDRGWDFQADSNGDSNGGQDRVAQVTGNTSTATIQDTRRNDRLGTEPPCH